MVRTNTAEQNSGKYKGITHKLLGVNANVSLK